MTGGRFPTHEAEERLRAVGARGVPVVPLQGTPGPPLPSHVTDAVAEALGRMDAPPPRGLVRLQARLAEVVARTGRAVDPEHELVITNGAMHALTLAFRSLLARGDEVVVPAPCFFFAGPIRSAGGRPVYVRSRAEDGWAWDAEAIERAVGARTRALLLCSPGNPTGHLPDREQVEAVAEVARRHGLVLVVDEAYEATVWEGTLQSAFALVEQAILVRSLGKSLSMPHLRLGLAAGPRALLARIATTLEWEVLRIGLAPQAAALAILEGSQDWLARVRDDLAADRQAALAAVDGRLACAPPRGGPFLFASDGEDALAGRLLDHGIPAVDGRHFQAPGWARIPFGGARLVGGELRSALARCLDEPAG